MRFDKNMDYFEIWDQDIKALIHTTYKNIAADLACGYDPLGRSIQSDRAFIMQLEKRYSDTLERFKNDPAIDVQKYCYYDLKQHGVIE